MLKRSQDLLWQVGFDFNNIILNSEAVRYSALPTSSAKHYWILEWGNWSWFSKTGCNLFMTVTLSCLWKETVTKRTLTPSSSGMQMSMTIGTLSMERRHNGGYGMQPENMHCTQPNKFSSIFFKFHLVRLYFMVRFIIKNSWTCIGNAASICGLCITPTEFTSKLGEFIDYCPVSLALRGELVKATNKSLEFAAEYRYFNNSRLVYTRSLSTKLLTVPRSMIFNLQCTCTRITEIASYVHASSHLHVAFAF